jgi:hypothetical protein
MRILEIVSREEFEKLYPSIVVDEAMGESKTIECKWVKNEFGAYELETN